MTSALSVHQRQKSLQDMAQQDLDVLVVGGGVTGAGIALDAATRGLRVGIVEAQDWAQGTSSRSSKLVHGGLRYLYNFDFVLVAEALRERGLLLTSLAPHLVKAQPFLWPLKTPVIERSYSAIGVGLYDLMGQISHRGSVPIQKHHSKAGALKVFPDVREDQLTGAIRFYDSRVDDARLVITLVRTASRYGALAANRTQVVDYLKKGQRVSGAVVRDLEDGSEYQISAKHVINATGVWTEKTQALADTTGGLKVLASKGIHLVIPKDRIKGDAGLFLRTEKSVLFIIPWKRYWVIGTTDTTYQEDFVNPVADKEDIDYVLEHANAVLKSDLTYDDIIGTWAGLRPLLQPGTADGDQTKSTKVSREHTVTEAAPGLTVIAGGKLTTYRVMAQDAVDFALGEERAKALASRTEVTPLIGADGYHALWNQREKIALESGLSVDHIEDLLDRYGSDIFTLLDLIKEEETLGRELEAAPEYLRAEIAFGCTHEGALHLEDLMTLRTRLTYEKPDRGLAAVPEIADLAAVYLGWDEQRKQKEIDFYTKRCEAEAKAQGIAKESQAQAVRAAAPDIAPMQEL